MRWTISHLRRVRPRPARKALHLLWIRATSTRHRRPKPHSSTAVSVARAVKQVAPQPVMRNNRIDVEHAAAAASNEFGVDGPPGTARKAATATNMTAMTHSVTQRIRSGWARRTTIAPTAAAAAMPPAVMTSAAPWVTTPDQSNAAAPSTAVHRHAAIAVNRAGTRSASAASITVCHASPRVHCGAGAAAVISNNSSPSRIALSYRLVASSSCSCPTRDRYHCRPSTAATGPRWTRSTIDGSSAPMSVSLGSARSTESGPC